MPDPDQYSKNGIYKYGRAPVSADSVSAFSVIRSLPRPEKKIGKLKK
jgi:hypothetical protein